MDLVWLWLHIPVYLGEKKSLRQGLGSNIMWKDQGVKEEGSETGDNWKWTFKGVSPRWPLFQKVTRLLDKCLDSYIKHPCFRAGDVAQLVQCLSRMQKSAAFHPQPYRKPGVAVHPCKYRTWGMEARESNVHAQLHAKFEASLGYILWALTFKNNPCFRVGHSWVTWGRICVYFLPSSVSTGRSLSHKLQVLAWSVT